MAFHFCAHSWDVRDVNEGTVVTLRNRDLAADSVSDLIEDLLALVQESGRPNLTLDFSEIGLVGSVVLGKIVSLGARLRERGGRLTLVRLNSSLYEMFEATQLTGVLDLRRADTAESIA
ncbi:MAG: STAS domain-containing protein [Planctomycetes bacterium]|nr:STAS domain-containing protein [Planctomycetota bacterium]